MSAVTLDLPCRQAGTAQWAAVAFAASYSSPGTRQAYATQLRLIHPGFGGDSVHWIPTGWLVSVW
jgi:hypothetical protein